MKLLLMMAMSWAQENGAEHLAENAENIAIPWNSIFVQAFNFALLLGLLGYLLRKSVKQHFIERAQSYQELVDRAEKARSEAETSNHKIKERLQKLEASAGESVARAKAEAEELRARLMQEAKELTVKLQLEAQRSSGVELEKAKAELRKELLESALTASRENLSKTLNSSEQKKLQNEFVEKIEVVSL